MLLRRKEKKCVFLCYADKKSEDGQMMNSGDDMRVAICEDNQEHAKILQCMIQRWAKKETVNVDIGYYQSAEQFLFLMKEDAHYDLVFLDIQLKKIDGLQLARLIRRDDQTIFLVFTTGSGDYALKGYEVSAFRYLVKPLKENEVFATLSKVKRMIGYMKKEAVIVSYNDEARRICKNDIYYIEVDNHHITLHTEEENIRFRAKLKEFEQQFEQPQFCKCHRSYIVNLHYVKRISKEGVEMEDGELIPISRANWNNLNRCYLTYYTRR